MKPDPPVTRTRLTRRPRAHARRGSRAARTSGWRRPSRCWEAARDLQQAVAGLVVDLARGALERVEDDVLVEPRGHAVRQEQATGVAVVEHVARILVLPPDDLLEALDLDQPQRGGELAHAEVEPRSGVVGLAVVAVAARELGQLGMAGHEHPALARRDRLRRVERIDAGVAPRAGPAAVPAGAVGVGAVLEQDDVVLGAVGGDALALEGEVAAACSAVRSITRAACARPTPPR